MKHSATPIILDVISFFLVTIDLYGEERLKKLSTRINLIAQSQEFPENFVAPLILPLGVVSLIAGFSYPFARMYNDAHGIHHADSMIEYILWRVFLFAFVAPLVAFLLATVGQFLLVKVKFAGLMVPIGAVLYVISKYLEYSELGD